MKRFVTFAALCAFAGARAASAVEAPTLVTWQLDPYSQATTNVVAAIERVTRAADGGLTVDVGFSMEPSRAPTMQFLLSSSKGRTVSILCEETACTFPTQTMDLEGRWVYGYTLPAPTHNGKAIDPARVAVIKRCRFGGSGGRRFEGGGYMVVADEGIYVGRSGTFAIGGQTHTFSGGVLLEPTLPTAETPAPAARARAALPPDTPTMIRGKRLSFPVSLPAKEPAP